MSLGVWWSACHRYELSDIIAALTVHMEDPVHGHHPPKPAEIAGHLSRAAKSGLYGHLPADEAWAIAIEAMDEDGTVVWTQEMAEAWGCARLIMAAGDEVGARMAFRSAYERRAGESRADGRRPKWSPSLGHDPARRAAAIEAAADRLGLPHLAGQAAIQHQSWQPQPPEVRAWIARARLAMVTQAPRPGGEMPLDEVVAALPVEREARRRALAQMMPGMERRVRHVLGEAEKKRQLDEMPLGLAP
ncbi:MAG: hypothetical protein ACREXK_14635 [Gammaproteobacteria bacterium]